MARPEVIDCVLFDCDGVLVDSEPVSARRLVKVFAALGVPATFDDAMTLCGTDGVKETPLVAAKYGMELTSDELDAKQTEMREEGLLPATIYLDADLQPIDGIRELLVRLRDSGVRTGLVSTTCSAHILTLLNRFGLTGLFDVIVCGDMVNRRKPNPEPYRTAMGFLGVEPGRVVVVEDSPTGISAGVASGAYVLGFTGSSVVQDVSAAAEVLPSFAAFDLV